MFLFWVLLFEVGVCEVARVERELSVREEYRACGRGSFMVEWCRRTTFYGVFFLNL